MSQVAVYRIVNTANNSLYFGLSVQPKERFAQHKRAARSGAKSPMYAAMRKHGIGAFKMEILDWCPDKATADELEIFFIAESKEFRYRVYNIAVGGQGFAAGELNPGWGVPLSAERKEKISAARKGRGRAHTAESKAKIAEANKRRVYSDETKRKISMANTGRVLSVEHKAKISAGGKGVRRSAETRVKMSAAQKGRHVSDETRAKMSEIFTGRIYGPRSEETKAKMRAAWERRKQRKFEV